MTKARILISLSILIFLLIFPYWVYLPALFLAAVFFPYYWEGIILAFVVDTLYGFGLGTNFAGRFPVALGVSILVLIVPLARKHLRINA